ncbi:MAG: hypothetical protein N2746_08245 [Deltaproteobacteria bacterium]|nr:hypothetical protein [Deltaproteobacteria bacterium]
MFSIICFIITAFLSLPVAGQELYRYVDENGIEHIVDSPYKLPEGIREKHINDYEKKKKLPPPVDLQDTRPAYKDMVRDYNKTEEDNRKLQENKKKLDEEKKKKLEELTKQLEDTIAELGYKSQRALITQIPEIKEEVENLRRKVEDIKREIETLKGEEDKSKK